MGVQDLSNEDLMKAYGAGDMPAFEALHRRLSPKVYGYLQSRLKRQEDAEDLTQKVFAKVHRLRESYNPEYPVLQWLFVITKSVLLDHGKAEFRKTRLEGEFVRELSQTPQGPSLSGVMDEQALLQGLDPASREVVQLRVFDELSFQEIAAQLGKSEVSLRQVFSRAMKRLRTRQSKERER